jgi:hypothetical protein
MSISRTLSEDLQEDSIRLLNVEIFSEKNFEFRKFSKPGNKRRPTRALGHLLFLLAHHLEPHPATSQYEVKSENQKTSMLVSHNPKNWRQNCSLQYHTLRRNHVCGFLRGFSSNSQPSKSGCTTPVISRHPQLLVIPVSPWKARNPGIFCRNSQVCS